MSKNNDSKPKRDWALFRKRCLDMILKPRVFDKNPLIEERYAQVRNRARKHYDMWVEILERSESVVGSNELDIWVSEWNKVHPKLTTSSGSVYRVRGKVARHGLISLLNEGDVPQSTVEGKYFEVFLKTYFPSVRSAYETVVEIALKDGAFTDAKAFPSKSAFERKLRSMYPPERLKALRYKIRENEVPPNFENSRQKDITHGK